MSTNKVSHPTAQINNLCILSAPPRVLCKRHSSHDNIVEDVVAKADFLKAQNAPVNPCNDAATLFCVD